MEAVEVEADLFLFNAKKPPVMPNPKRAPRVIARKSSFIMDYFR